MISPSSFLTVYQLPVERMTNPFSNGQILFSKVDKFSDFHFSFFITWNESESFYYLYALKDEQLIK